VIVGGVEKGDDHNHNIVVDVVAGFLGTMMIVVVGMDVDGKVVMIPPVECFVVATTTAVGVD
jgi:hypothetical protein